MLSEFITKPYRNNRILEYQKRMLRPVTRDEHVVDRVMASVLASQGYTWDKDSSSIYDPQVLFDTLERYSPSKSVSFDMSTSEWRKAISIVFKLFSKPKEREPLKRLETVEEVRHALKLEKSSGLPMLSSKEDDFYYALNREIQVRNGLKAPTPCIAYKRTQLGGKTRLVWGYPIEMTILESRYAAPLIDLFLVRRTPMAFGLSKFELGARVEYINQRYGKTYGLDFSKFDSTVPKQLIEVAFNILSTWFSPEELGSDWQKIVDYFIYTPIVMPNGKLYRGKRHGVPSGSFFTQLVDSIVNCLVQFWLSLKHKYSLGWEGFLVLGDDVLISIPSNIRLEHLSRSLKEIGLIMHPEKTLQEAHFLGAYWKKGIPYRPINEIVKKMVYPERYRKYPSQSYYDRRALALMLIHQYASSYANVINMLSVWYNSGNVGMMDEAPLFVEAYANALWQEIHNDAFLHVGLGHRGSKRHLLSARLLA